MEKKDTRGRTAVDLLEIEHNFIAQFYSSFIDSVSISDLKHQYHRQRFTLTEGEALEDSCLSVWLRDEPDDTIYLPSRYEEMRVFYYPIREIISPR